jgi:hypothetical protein
MTLLVSHVPVVFQVLSHLILYGCLKHLTGSGTQNFFQHRCSRFFFRTSSFGNDKP